MAQKDTMNRSDRLVLSSSGTVTSGRAPWNAGLKADWSIIWLLRGLMTTDEALGTIDWLPGHVGAIQAGGPVNGGSLSRLKSSRLKPFSFFNMASAVGWNENNIFISKQLVTSTLCGTGSLEIWEYYFL